MTMAKRTRRGKCAIISRLLSESSRAQLRVWRVRRSIGGTRGLGAGGRRGTDVVAIGRAGPTLLYLSAGANGGPGKAGSVPTRGAGLFPLPLHAVATEGAARGLRVSVIRTDVGTSSPRRRRGHGPAPRQVQGCRVALRASVSSTYAPKPSSPERSGPTHECRLVLPKAVPHLTFGLLPRLRADLCDVRVADRRA